MRLSNNFFKKNSITIQVVIIGLISLLTMMACLFGFQTVLSLTSKGATVKFNTVVLLFWITSILVWSNSTEHFSEMVFGENKGSRLMRFIVPVTILGTIVLLSYLLNNDLK